VYILHCTWLVNSAAHLWGDHPYDPLSYAAENPVVSFFAIGEGWHNYHHKYPYDYACSEFGVSSQYNPSKLFIDLMAFFGLVWGRRRATSAWALNRTRRDRDEKAGVPMSVLATRPWEIVASNAAAAAIAECDNNKSGRKHDDGDDYYEEEEMTTLCSLSYSSVSLESDDVATVVAIDR